MFGFPEDYFLYEKFIDRYSSQGFLDIDRSDQLIIDLEELTEKNNQYYFIADLFEGKVIFTSKHCKQILGIDCEELNPYHNLNAVHPDDLQRNTSGWARMLTLGSELVLNKTEIRLFSTNMRLRNPQGEYPEVLFQCLMFYSEAYNTVFDLQLHTNIDSILDDKGFRHYYSGNDPSNFRFPDKELLSLGFPFTKREFEILKLIGTGLSSEQVAEKLFLSVNTVDTHRRNIIKKSDKTQISDLIYYMQREGIL